MLKHEEMIENVHRRIAQYEEEKKMKHSKLKYIISAINPKTKKESVKTNEYTDVVSGTDTFNSSKCIMHTVSSLAAAAVLVTGIGATGFMLHKNNANKTALPEEDVICTEPIEIADHSAVAPFADFRQIYFGVKKLNKYDEIEYSDATYDKLAVFLNNFIWGEENKVAESDIPDFDNCDGNGYNGKGYVINWRKGDVWLYVYVTGEGKAYYLERKCTPDGNSFYYPIIESSVFNIDYETFDKNIQDILISDVPDTDAYISKMDKMYLTQGEFQNGNVEHREGYYSEELIPEGHRSFKALQGFLRDDFVDMLQKDKSIGHDSNEHLYTVACYYKTSNTTTRRLTYYISSNGVVNLCEYELTKNASIPTGCLYYYIDIEEFENVLDDILSGKYNDKYLFEAKITTTAGTTTTTTSTSTTTSTTLAEMTIVTTAEQDNVSEEETEDEPVEKEPTDDDIFREYYLSIHNGWDGSFNGTYEAMDENGNMVDFKDEINCLIYRAGMYFPSPSDRVLGPIINEEDAIAKGREILLKLQGQEYIDNHDKTYIIYPNGTKVIRDNPCYLADYNEEYDIWDFRPTLFSGTAEDGSFHVGTPGSVPRFYIRGCDGKILACFH